MYMFFVSLVILLNLKYHFNLKNCVWVVTICFGGQVHIITQHK